MSDSIQVSLNETLTGLVQSAQRNLAPRVIHKEIANAAAIECRQHFRMLEATRPNKLGGTRTHFWGQYTKTVVPRADDTDAVVAISDPQSSGAGKSPLALHYFGGIVRAVKSKFLTIPAVAAAHGVRAREWVGKLHFALVGGRYPALVLRDNEGKGNRKLYGSQVIYWLRKAVTIKADTDVLPSDDRLLTVAQAAAQRLVDRLAARGGAA
jgi:hypothetical protein